MHGCWQGERSTCTSFEVLSTRTAVPLSICHWIDIVAVVVFNFASFQWPRTLISFPLSFVNNICRPLAKMGLRCAVFL